MGLGVAAPRGAINSFRPTFEHRTERQDTVLYSVTSGAGRARAMLPEPGSFPRRSLAGAQEVLLDVVPLRPDASELARHLHREPAVHLGLHVCGSHVLRVLPPHLVRPLHLRGEDDQPPNQLLPVLLGGVRNQERRPTLSCLRAWLQHALRREHRELRGRVWGEVGAEWREAVKLVEEAERDARATAERGLTGPPAS